MDEEKTAPPASTVPQEEKMKIENENKERKN